MVVALDSATEKRIQRQIDLGRYREPAEVVADALALLDEQRETEEFYRRRAAGGDGKALLAILDKGPYRDPDSGDEL